MPPFNLTLTQATDSAARLVVHGAEGHLLRGSLRGPRSRFARTLPASFALRSGEPGVGVFDVAEPCYWSPNLPMLYDLAVEVVGAGGTVDSHCLAVGLRRLVERGPNLLIDRRRMVFRGWFRAEGKVDWDALRAERLGLVGERFDDATRRTAAEWGVLLLETATESATPLEPAVMGAGGLVVVEDADIESVGHAVATGEPVIAVRRDPLAIDAPAARRACERLQADLAPHTALAGYVV